MYRKIPILNKHIEEKRNSDMDKKLKLKLIEINSRKNRYYMIDREPFKPMHVNKVQKERHFSVNKDNIILAKKLNMISSSIGFKEDRHMERSLDLRDWACSRSKLSMMRQTFENMNLMKRINEKKPFLVTRKLLKEDRRRVDNLRICCEYPLILT